MNWADAAQNEKNLITGTRYLNTEGMQPFELEVLEYIRNTGNHVLYRVTPIFEGDNLVADGVEMEAVSVEDHTIMEKESLSMSTLIMSSQE